MDAPGLIKGYLQGDSVTMQIATSSSGRPWICTVYFVVDDQLNLYWLSLPSQRHSREVIDNDEVAIAVAVKTDLPVIGLQIEGSAEVVEDETVVREVMERYKTKYQAGKDFYTRFIHGTNKHVMYKCIPNKVYLFDEVNFGKDDRQEYKL